MKHTPGPWHASALRDCGWIDIFRIEEDGGRSLPFGAVKHFDQEANARLIAAAPDLLEALKHIEGVAMADEWRDLPEIAKLARAAISKAEGEQ